MANEIWNNFVFFGKFSHFEWFLIGNIETKPYARQDNGNGYSDNNRYGGHFASQGSNSGYGLSGGQPIKNNGQVYAQWWYGVFGSI